MAKFPTYDEIAKKVAEEALDEFLYNGKSIREWLQIIASKDCISRRFSSFTDDELDMMEEAFCNEGLKYLVFEIRKERNARQERSE